MENDVFKTNPVFQNLSPEKLSFLMNFANSKKPTEMKDMMPFLLGTLSSAKKQNIQFTKPETELMISILKQSMSPEEAEKADKIIRLMKERSLDSLNRGRPLLSHTLYDACFHLAISYQIVATFTFSTLSIGATLVPLPSVPSKYFELADSNKT